MRTHLVTLLGMCCLVASGCSYCAAPFDECGPLIGGPYDPYFDDCGAFHRVNTAFHPYGPGPHEIMGPYFEDVPPPPMEDRPYYEAPQDGEPTLPGPTDGDGQPIMNRITADENSQDADELAASEGATDGADESGPILFRQKDGDDTAEIVSNDLGADQ